MEVEPMATSVALKKLFRTIAANQAAVKARENATTNHAKKAQVMDERIVALNEFCKNNGIKVAGADYEAIKAKMLADSGGPAPDNDYDANAPLTDRDIVAHGGTTEDYTENPSGNEEVPEGREDPASDTDLKDTPNNIYMGEAGGLAGSGATTGNAKRYVKSAADVPEGYQAQTGSHGGTFYETDGGGAPPAGTEEPDFDAAALAVQDVLQSVIGESDEKLAHHITGHMADAFANGAIQSEEDEVKAIAEAMESYGGDAEAAASIHAALAAAAGGEAPAPDTPEMGDEASLEDAGMPTEPVEGDDVAPALDPTNPDEQFGDWDMTPEEDAAGREAAGLPPGDDDGDDGEPEGDLGDEAEGAEDSVESKAQFLREAEAKLGATGLTPGVGFAGGEALDDLLAEIEAGDEDGDAADTLDLWVENAKEQLAEQGLGDGGDFNADDIVGDLDDEELFSFMEADRDPAWVSEILGERHGLSSGMGDEDDQKLWDLEMALHRRADDLEDTDEYQDWKWDQEGVDEGDREYKKMGFEGEEDYYIQMDDVASGLTGYPAINEMDIVTALREQGIDDDHPAHDSMFESLTETLGDKFKTGSEYYGAFTEAVYESASLPDDPDLQEAVNAGNLDEVIEDYELAVDDAYEAALQELGMGDTDARILAGDLSGQEAERLRDEALHIDPEDEEEDTFDYEPDQDLADMSDEELEVAYDEAVAAHQAEHGGLSRGDRSAVEKLGSEVTRRRTAAEGEIIPPEDEVAGAVPRAHGIGALGSDNQDYLERLMRDYDGFDIMPEDFDYQVSPGDYNATEKNVRGWLRDTGVVRDPAMDARWGSFITELSGQSYEEANPEDDDFDDEDVDDGSYDEGDGSRGGDDPGEPMDEEETLRDMDGGESAIDLEQRDEILARVWKNGGPISGEEEAILRGAGYGDESFESSAAMGTWFKGVKEGGPEGLPYQGGAFEDEIFPERSSSGSKGADDDYLEEQGEIPFNSGERDAGVPRETESREMKDSKAMSGVMGALRSGFGDPPYTRAEVDDAFGAHSGVLDDVSRENIISELESMGHIDDPSDSWSKSSGGRGFPTYKDGPDGEPVLDEGEAESDGGASRAELSRLDDGALEERFNALGDDLDAMDDDDSPERSAWKRAREEMRERGLL